MTAAVAWHGHDRASSEYRRILIGLGAAGIATFAQIYSPQGALPVIATSLGVSAETAALSVSFATIGVAVAVIPWSIAADRFGRLLSMRIAIVSSAVFGLLVAVSPSLEFLLTVRLLEGIALGGLPAIAISYLHEEVHAGAAAAAAAAYISGTTIGGASGRLVSGPLAGTLGWRPALLIVAVLCAVAATIFLALMPRARGYVRQRSSVADVARRLATCLADPTLRRVYAVQFMQMCAFVAVYNYLAFRLEAPPFGLATSVASAIFLAYAAGTVSSRLAGRWIPRFGSRRVVLGGLFTLAVGVAIMQLQSIVAITVGLLMFTAAFFAVHTAAVSWAGSRLPRVRGQATALYNVSMYSGSALGGWAIGYAWTAWGWSGLTITCLVLIVAAAVVARGLPRADALPS